MSILRAIKVNHFDILEKRKNWAHTYWAFDLHGTVIKSNYEAGNIPTEFYPYAKEVLQMLTNREDIVAYIYTCSHPHEQEQYLDLFKENGIRFKWVNKNMDVVTDNQGYGYYEDKPYFNVLFEDKAGFNPNTDWEIVRDYFKYKDSKFLTFIHKIKRFFKNGF